METFLRTVGIYLFLLVLFRLSGKRALSELSTFDFVLLLIISEATQNALIGEDYSVTTGMAVILTLVLLDLGLSILTQRFTKLQDITEGTPLVLVDHGRLLEERMRKTHVSREEILQVARQNLGLERLEQIKYAVLENSGGISIIPMAPAVEDMLDRRIEEALDRRARQPPAR